MQSSSKLEVVPYEPRRRGAWNSLVDAACATHFFFRREYMEYHAVRFLDLSLIVLADDRPIAALPANRAGNIVHSHQGLTFGGLIVAEKGMSAVGVMRIFDLMLKFLKDSGVASLVYKPLPHIFRGSPAEEDLYALHRCGAKVIRRELSSVIALGGAPKYGHGKRENMRKAARAGLVYERSTEYESFHQILVCALGRHSVQPAHSAGELGLLAERFPSNIHLYVARGGGEIVAGVLLFENDLVVHTQYMANSERGREIGALDGLVDHLITKVYPHKRYFSFGISTEQEGRELNEGLVRSKEGFGATGLVHDWYELDLT